MTLIEKFIIKFNAIPDLTEHKACFAGLKPSSNLPTEEYRWIASYNGNTAETNFN